MIRLKVRVLPTGVSFDFKYLRNNSESQADSPTSSTKWLQILGGGAWLEVVYAFLRIRMDLAGLGVIWGGVVYITTN